MGQNGIRNAVKWSNAMVMRSSKNNSFGVKPTAHNGLVGGSSPPGPTTQSCVCGDFLTAAESAANWRNFYPRHYLHKDCRGLSGEFGRAVSGLGILFPGKTEIGWRETGSN